MRHLTKVSIMAIPEQDHHDFVENSYLTYVIPSRTSVSIEELFGDAEDSKSIFDSIEQRESLFFGACHHLNSLSCSLLTNRTR